MKPKQYPYQGWTLSPSYTPTLRTFVSDYGYGYDESDSKKAIHREDIYPDKAACILEGQKKLKEARARIVKSAAKLDAKERNLWKAQKI